MEYTTPSADELGRFCSARQMVAEIMSDLGYDERVDTAQNEFQYVRWMFQMSQRFSLPTAYGPQQEWGTKVVQCRAAKPRGYAKISEVYVMHCGCRHPVTFIRANQGYGRRAQMGGGRPFCVADAHQDYYATTSAMEGMEMCMVYLPYVVGPDGSPIVDRTYQDAYKAYIRMLQQVKDNSMRGNDTRAERDLSRAFKGALNQAKSMAVTLAMTSDQIQQLSASIVNPQDAGDNIWMSAMNARNTYI